MVIKTAKTAGFCFGVERVVRRTLNEAENGRVYTLGPVIHNKAVTGDFEKRNVRIIEHPFELEKLPEGKTIIRAHGVPPETEVELKRMGIPYIDCTCPFVKKIHGIVSNACRSGRKVIILGDAHHPEIIGINGYTGYTAFIAASKDDIEKLPFNSQENYVLVSQTTFNTKLFDEITAWLSENGITAEIYNTICEATSARQREADELSKTADAMFVIGDKTSSNSVKLYEICKKNQINTFFIENPYEIKEKLLNIHPTFGMIIGVTAGASTPPAIIKEAVAAMSELNPGSEQNFENMIAGASMVLRTGETVRGTVIKVSNGEVFVDLGYKSDGVIQKNEYSDDHEADPAKDLNPGDVIEVHVLRVNDGEGNVLLSKKRADGRKHMLDIEDAFKSGAPLKGKITEVIKGGCIAVINGVRAFVPSSQAASRYIPDLNVLKGQEMSFNILEFDKSKRRIVAGRKDLAAKETQEKRDKAFVTINIGDRLRGTVSRIAQFGAFVDLGGVDGLIHISEIRWGRIRRVTDVIKEGDVVDVNVIGMDKEKGKISLSLKESDIDPWSNIEERYSVGSIVDGKVARIAPFGAFIELEDGVDGLVHISQVASRHIEKIEEELKPGQMIKVKVTAVSPENKRISLSKKAADNEIFFDYIEDDVYDAEEEYYPEDDGQGDGFYDESAETEIHEEAVPVMSEETEAMDETEASDTAENGDELEEESSEA